MKIISKSILTELKRIKVEGGDVLHGLKKSDSTYINFGEAYFSFVNENCIKAWKKHNKMTLNLIVPIGKIRFALLIDPINGVFHTVEIGENRYFRLTIPPGIWFGFKGVGTGSNLLMNIADIEHDPDEVERCENLDFKYNWK